MHPAPFPTPPVYHFLVTVSSLKLLLLPHARRAISALPPVENPLSPSPPPHAPQKLATSQTLNHQVSHQYRVTKLNSPRSAPGLRHNMTGPFAPHAVLAALACTCTPLEPLHVLTSSGIPWPLPGAARPSRVRVRVSRLHCQRDPELPASCCASVYTESSAHMRRGHSHAISRDHGNPFPHR